MLYDNVKRLCAERMISVRELEKSVGYAQGTINRWNKTAPRRNSVQPVADYFGVSIEELRGNEQIEPNAEILPQSKIHMIPVYRSVGAARYGAETDSNVLEFLPLYIASGNPEDYFGVIVKGDSMTPKIDNGDIIVINRSEPINDGDIAVVYLDEERESAVVKKIFFGDNKITLRSINTEYEDRVLKGEALERFSFGGRVIKVVKSL